MAVILNMTFIFSPGLEDRFITWLKDEFIPGNAGYCSSEITVNEVIQELEEPVKAYAAALPMESEQRLTTCKTIIENQAQQGLDALMGRNNVLIVATTFIPINLK